MTNKNKILQTLQNKKQIIEKMYIVKEKDSKDLLEDYQSIKSDVEGNFENIINSIELMPF